MISAGVAALALFVVGAPALADDVMHDGKLVSITGNKLVMTVKTGQEHSHTLTANAKFTLDGKACKADDLKPGARIRVTTPAADKTMASHIEAIDQHKDFAVKSHDGRFVSITGEKLVMTNKAGQEHSHAMSADAKVTLDGKISKASDLKPGLRIRVTLENDAPHAAARVEAIEKNLDFASL